MKKAKALLFALALGLGGLAIPASAQVNPSSVPAYQPGDVTHILGSQPYFSTGLATDQYGNWYKAIVDSTSSTPAAVGNLVTYSGSTPSWTQNTVAGQVVAPGAYGIVSQAAAASGKAAQVEVRGQVSALCTTGTVAIAIGSFLIADGAGNLTVPAPSAAPSSASATPQGTTGAATVTYVLYARNAYGLDSVASSNDSTSTANATLSPANSVVVAATVPAGTTQVVVVRSVGGASQGVIGSASVAPAQTKVNFLDYGQAAGAASYTPNATPTFAAGQVLGIALGTLAGSTSTPTAVSAFVGGF